MDDVFIERLQVLQLSAFDFEFGRVAAQALRQQAREVGHGHEIKQIAEDPSLQLSAAGHGDLHAGQDVVEDEFGQASDQNEAEPGDNESSFPRKQNTRDDDGQRVQPNEVAVLRSCQINQAGHDEQVEHQ